MIDKLQDLRDNLQTVIHGKDEVIELLIIALCAGGNVLLEDVPGVGKTTIAKALALSIDGTFDRVQFTPDLLPSDILGSSMYNPSDAKFHFRQGPIFTNILLADEINRASPRTQSSLLEAMNERQVTVDGNTYTLDAPFLVIATENPIEYHGTYPLPEAQLDRFAVQLTLGYPDEEHELEILYSRKESDPLDVLKPVLTCGEVSKIQSKVGEVQIEKTVAAYIVKLIRATRVDSRLQLGASPRALITLSRCAQASAYINGREYIVPDDVKRLAGVVLSHRVVLENKVKYSGVSPAEVIEEILKTIEVPS